jgi:DNA-binding response OmpR family regulator
MEKNFGILVLDDDPDICAMLKMVLDYHGYITSEADNEIKAKEVLDAAPIGLIIMDMLLSGADGTDICSRLKKDQLTSSIPILMFSAHPNAKATCLAAGADDFISKPFEMNDLLARVKSFLQPQEVKEAE